MSNIKHYAYLGDGTKTACGVTVKPMNISIANIQETNCKECLKTLLKPFAEHIRYVWKNK